MTTQKVIDPLIIALFDRLPARGTQWPIDDRMRWLRAMSSTIDLCYALAPDDAGMQIDFRPDTRDGDKDEGR